MNITQKEYDNWTGSIDLENKLIRANKRAEGYKKDRELARRLFVIVAGNLEQNREWLKNADLKQKKAWIAFYIATTLYIVGIIWIAIH